MASTPPDHVSDSTIDSAAACVSTANRLGVHLWVQEGELKFRCAPGALPPELAERLKSARAGIVRYLSLAATEAGVPDFRPMPACPVVPSYRRTTWEGMRDGRIGVDSMNCHAVVRFRHAFEPEHFEAAVAALAQQHQVLGATLVPVRDGPALSFDRQQHDHVRRDLSSTPAEQREQAARRLVAEIVWTPFEVSRSLLRSFVICLRRDDHICGIVVHHMISDGVSMQILLRDLASMMNAASQPRPAPLSSAFQYRDYLLALHEWLERPPGKRHQQFWRDTLRGYHPVVLANSSDGIGVRESFTIDRTLVRQLESIARNRTTTIFVVLLAVQYVMLAYLTGRPDVTIGGVVSGRELPVLQPIVGYMADRVYWRVHLDGNPSFAEIIERVRRAIDEAAPFQFIRSDMLGEVLPQGGSMRAPVFNFTPYKAREARGATGPEPVPVDPAPFATGANPGMCYWLALQAGPEGMRGHFRYSTARVEGLLATFITTLQISVEDEERRLTQFAALLASDGMPSRTLRDAVAPCS